ncbi:GNAT family N-acetyltransferase [Colwellia sp. 1_MG-2023]|uniref:GNAT family N-acetyltransferase n=1 Tax=Colwellia sp. 1_MG-2023 TaxID=3062649 RepID=UPI0026E28987|nr:GNAT family N-acetyltransferase [Colwellia sp. 1_MG-2023]MDO6445361.1 GNAT family N-acetyltransferase [Colwellia sp. 1_MG-2023]
MTTPITFRALTCDDLPTVKQIIDETEMFPSEMLDEMTAPFFDHTNSDNEDLWFVACSDQPVAIAYCAPERMTDGTWNLLLIAVSPKCQGLGVGKKFMVFLEQQIQNIPGRILLVETSGLPEFAITRNFYPQCGYTQVACIPDFYEAGDDKIVFLKKLT